MIAAAGALLLPPVAKRVSDRLAGKWRITLSVALLIVGIGASGSSQKLQEQTTTKNTPTATQPTPPVQEAAAVSSRARAPFVYDIPSLFEKKYPQIKAMFGKVTDTTAYSDEKTEVWFAKNGFDLALDYNPKTNDVMEFFLSTDDPSGSTHDIEHLMDIGNLSTDDPRYKVTPVAVINDPSSYTGIKVQTVAVAQAGEERARLVKDAEKYNVYATVCAQQEVKAMLKAPSTAKFPWGSADHILYSPERKVFDVISYVDAENSYGAKI
ncbi:MAG: hypothetical protein O2904_01810, partial [bacterium]|nr:hypothetical protein [bacterium]